MFALPNKLLPSILPFAPLFSASVFSRACNLVVGAILAPGKRTVTSALRILGRSDEPDFQNFHRVLNRARWSALGASRILLTMLLNAFLPEGPVVMAVDETVERRRGSRIRAKGVYRDAVRSSKSHFVKTTGLRWLSFMLLAPVSWSGRVWALPFLTILSPSRRFYTDQNRSHQTVLDRARQGVRLIKSWLPDRLIVLVADSSYACVEWLASVCPYACVITRLRLDAALYEPPPPRAAGRRGAPRKKGKKLPKLSCLVETKSRRWKKIRVSLWYGERDRVIEIQTGTALWYRSGAPVVPIRWVLIRDPEGRFAPAALLSTDTGAQAGQIVCWFVGRWQVEVTYEEVRVHLGVESQRQWSDKAVGRTTPVLLGLFSLVTLMANQLLSDKESMPVRGAAWYKKEIATFSDTIALVRQHLWGSGIIGMSDSQSDHVKIPRTLFNRFSDALCYAQ